MRHLIGQQIIMGIQGQTLLPDEAEFIVQNNIGGICLFGRNVSTPDQVHALCTQIQNLRHRMPDQAPIFISIDMEGGRVHRLKPPFTKWPALSHIGKIDSTSVAFKFAQSMGDELRAVGINVDWAPCVDIFSNPENKVIGDRALATNGEAVGRLGSALVRGYIKSDVIPCAKHFPGHGNTFIDSHENLPVEEKTLEQLEELELEPFKKVFRARLDMVMIAHIKYPKIDPDFPASLSEIFIRKILRDSLRYRGLVVTDDLDMKALTLNFSKGEIAKRALKAGANLLLYCNEPDSPPTALDAIEAAIQSGEMEKSIVQSNYNAILALKRKLKIIDPLPEDEMRRLVGNAEHLRLAQAILDGSVPAELVTL